MSRKKQCHIFILFFSLLTIVTSLTIGVPGVKALDIGIIGGATTDSEFEDGILSLEVEGGSGVIVSVASTYYAQIQLPSSLEYIIRHPEIKNHIKLEYALPAPLLGFIPIRGEILGEDLIIDETFNVISGGVMVPINLSLIGVYRFTFKIDITGLDVTIPADNYQFSVTASEKTIDLDLLEFSQTFTNLSFEYVSSAESEPALSATTDVFVSFLPNVNEAPPILKPEDPTEEFLNPPDNPTGDINMLSIDYVSSIDFGINEVSSNAQVYETTTEQPFIQVTDRRRNSDNGWGVIAKLSEFTLENDTKEIGILKGAKLVLDGGVVSSPIDSEPPYVFQDIALIAGDEATSVVWANSDSGKGTWITRWPINDKNVRLEVPRNSSQVGKHQATIEWTLMDVPTEVNTEK